MNRQVIKLAGKKILIVGMGLFCLVVTSGTSTALDRTELKIREALIYLKGVPEIAWVEVKGTTVVLGWKGYGPQFGKINRIASKKASRQVQKKIQVFSVHEDQKGWRPESEEPTGHLCQTIAEGGRLIKSNCR